MTIRRVLLPLIAVLLLSGCLLSGCLQVAMVPPQTPQAAANLYTVHSVAAWNRITGLGPEVWTKDGLGLQELRFYDATADGSPLYTRPDGKEMPKFSADMRANDVADFFAATLLASGLSVAETSNLRPFRFAGKRGFRFDVSIVNESGARYRGEAFGAVINKKLHLIVYFGHEEHYFEQSREDVETMIKGLQLKA
tara:strand:- start:1969 stop:2553 length:585 start_codon:yes stop_codon:yes gene_type:complete